MKRYKLMTAGFIVSITSMVMVFSTPLFALNGDANKTTSRLDALAKFTKTIGTIEKYYVDDITIKEIINKSIEGLMQNLDAHSSFLSKKRLKDLQVQTEGEFGGLGITVGMRDGALTVIAPIEGTPADKAGLKAGDIILKIEDESTLNMTIDEAVNKMRGKPKTTIHLTIVRKDEPKPIEVTIVRDIIKIDSVYTKLIESENMLYIRITSFDKKVTKDVKKAIEDNPNVKGIVIDLRNNPGGLLSQAVGLVDLFVDEGVIVSQKGRIKGENSEYKASKESTITKLPISVLVNGGSASASEIVSGALQDHKRAVLVGEKTFGKGSVQVILPIDKEEALKLTIARYYLPSGRTIQAKGVIPDVIIHPGKVPLTNDDKFSIKESELKKHLKEELKKTETKKQKKETKQKDSKDKEKKNKKIITKDDINNDIQLKFAIDAIKILNINKD